MSEWEADVLFISILPGYWIFIAFSFTCDVSRATKTEIIPVSNSLTKMRTVEKEKEVKLRKQQPQQ